MKEAKKALEVSEATGEAKPFDNNEKLDGDIDELKPIKKKLAQPHDLI